MLAKQASVNHWLIGNVHVLTLNFYISLAALLFMVWLGLGIKATHLGLWKKTNNNKKTIGICDHKHG